MFVSCYGSRLFRSDLNFFILQNTITISFHKAALKSNIILFFLHETALFIAYNKSCDDNYVLPYFIFILVMDHP